VTIHATTVKVPPGYLVIDLECTTNKEKKLKAHDGNRVWMAGMMGEVHTQGATTIDIETRDREPGVNKPLRPDKFKVLVGHNLKYDLEYLVREPDVIRVWLGNAVGVSPLSEDFWPYLRKHACVLDTQFVTYLHSGHTMTYASLDATAEYWGVPTRKGLDLGKELEKVDHDIRRVPDLEEYLRVDLEMTAEILNKILSDPWVISNFKWILQMHDGYLGCFEMEYNGMHVDPARLIELRERCEAALLTAQADLVARSGLLCFNPSSNDHVSAYLFGGEIEEEKRVPVGTYMSGAKLGQPRYKIERISHTLSRKVVPLPSWRGGTSGKISVGEEVLREILASGLQRDFVESLLTYRELSKLNGTYLEGLGKYLRLDSDGKYFVYPQTNVCQTATGRTSSSKPNSQNNPTNDSMGVASIYTSRFGSEGILLEVDVKQAEVLALAILSRDEVLRDDLLSGRDIHAETGKPVFGASMTDEQRRVMKTINFGLIYGGGAKTLAGQAKVALGVATKAINSFYERYPKVDDYFTDFFEVAQEALNIRGKKTGVTHPNGVQQKSVVIDSPTGRRYCYKDYFSEKTKRVSVSYTETRNYPIQGMATGDMMLAGLGDLWRYVLPKFKDVRIVGLVHDSMRFDLKLDSLDSFMRDLGNTLENAGEALNKACKKEVWDLPIKVTFKTGPNFFNMTKVEL
jgi:hypothetical protein